MRDKQTLLVLMTSLVLLISCVPKHDDIPDYAKFDGTCGATLKAAFDGGYHALVITYCQSCHQNEHANADSELAFNSFFNYGEQAVYVNATSGKHNPPLTGDFLKAEFDVERAKWKTAKETFVSCVESQ